MSLSIIHVIRGRLFANGISDETYYAQASYEVQNKIIMTAPPPLKASYGTNFARYIYAIGACVGIVMAYAIILSLISEFLRGTTLAPLPRALIKTGMLFSTVWACISAWKAIVKRNGK